MLEAHACRPAMHRDSAAAAASRKSPFFSMATPQFAKFIDIRAALFYCSCNGPDFKCIHLE
jgi:hypothetical protein